MLTLVASSVIDAPIEAVWAVLRDFDGHAEWHPAIADTAMERGGAADRVGAIRRTTLTDGSELREKLLTHSDVDMAYSACLLDTPIPLLNYVHHVRLVPVTDGDMTFVQWEARFDAPAGRVSELTRLVRDDWFAAGMAGLSRHVVKEGVDA